MKTKKYVPAHVRAIRLLQRLRTQLAAMNESPAHAVSWIEPRTVTTTRRISEIDTVIVALQEEFSVEP